MFNEIKAVALKEWLEFINQRGSVKATVLNTLLILVVTAIVFPTNIKNNDSEVISWIFNWCFLPSMLVLGMIPDSFAGERERHTLPTLLASGLSDSAIVLGKISVVVIYAWAFAIFFRLIVIAKVIILSNSKDLTFYHWNFFIIGIVASLLIAILTASQGILVSLNAVSVKQAYLDSFLRFFVFTLLLSLSFTIVLATIVFLVPEQIRNSLRIFVFSINSTMAISTMLFIFAVLDTLSIVYVLWRFQRSKLILDQTNK
jgi:ABC-2 type transport system permease protein